MNTAVQSTLVQSQQGTSLLEQDGVYVVEVDGKTVFEGNEVGAEFKYWGAVFGVDDDAEVEL